MLNLGLNYVVPTELYTLKVVEGNELNGREKNKAILGHDYSVKNKLFDKPVKLGDKILVNDVEIKVAGFYEEVGNPQDDSNIYMNYEEHLMIYRLL